MRRNRLFFTATVVSALFSGVTSAKAQTVLDEPQPPEMTFSAPAQTEREQTPLGTPAPVTVVPTRIVFGGKTLPTPLASSAPFRDPADNVLCVSAETLTPLGLIYVVDEKMGKVTFTNAEGTTTATVSLRTPPEKAPQLGELRSKSPEGVFVPINETLIQLGGACELDVATETLYLRSVLKSVTFVNGKLLVEGALPLSTPTVTRSEGGKKILLDFAGAEIGALPTSFTVNTPLISLVRTGQNQSDVARLVLELTEPSATFTVVENGATSDKLTSNINLSSLVALNVTVPKPRPTSAVKPRKNPGTPTVVSAVTFRKVSESRAQFIVRAGRTPVTRTALEKGRLTLDLLNATLAPNVAAMLEGTKHPFLKAAQIVARGNNAAQLVLDLTRVVNFSLKPDNNGNLILDIGLPRSTGGTLAGKLVVVDAGHGGSDSGARGVNGTREKDVALAISFKLAETLREQGANVLMTRGDDFFIPVSDRPKIANRAGADFFISVHADSAGSNHEVAGSTVYYHAYNPHCRSLAQCIADQFGEMGSIPSKGVRTDFIRFPGKADGSTGGFGVLRGAKMVSVLVETGYMSNARDVRYLNQSEMQTKIARAIAAGLKDYIEGNPLMDTKTIRPDAGEPVEPAFSELSSGATPSSEVSDSASAVAAGDTPETPFVPKDMGR